MIGVNASISDIQLFFSFNAQSWKRQNVSSEPGWAPAETKISKKQLQVCSQITQVKVTLANLIKGITSGQITLLNVVKALGEYLTAEEDDLRIKGVYLYLLRHAP